MKCLPQPHFTNHHQQQDREGRCTARGLAARRTERFGRHGSMYVKEKLVLPIRDCVLKNACRYIASNIIISFQLSPPALSAAYLTSLFHLSHFPNPNNSKSCASPFSSPPSFLWRSLFLQRFLSIPSPPHLSLPATRKRLIHRALPPCSTASYTVVHPQRLQVETAPPRAAANVVSDFSRLDMLM